MVESKQQSILQFYLVEQETQEWIAWANLMPTAIGTYSLFQVYTNEKYRGQGYGTRILNDVIHWANRNQAVIYLGVGGWGTPGLDNTQLTKWYASIGFEPQGYDKNGSLIMKYRGKRQ